jgi:glycosyltransferase involved in cell wall biosynthesis
MKIKFSFIIPTLNEEKRIGKCLKSIKKQKRKDYEIIVVDSFSKDRTAAVSRKYGARVILAASKGPSRARNVGAKRAKGEIFVFPDADVKFKSDFLDKLDRWFERDIGGGIPRILSYDSYRGYVSISYKFSNLIARFLIAAGIAMTMGSCFIYRKSVFNKVGGFNPEFLTNEDHDLAERAAKVSRFVYFKDIEVGTSSRRPKRWGMLKTTKVYIKSTLIFFLNHKYLRDYWT